MKYILSIVLLLTFSQATTQVAKKVRPKPPTVIVPERPVIQPILHQDNYYSNNNYYEPSHCDYRHIIETKNAEIQKLKDKIKELESGKAERLQKELREKHEAELKKFENRD